MIKLKTTGVTIRIPQELVDSIDSWVMPRGPHTSRPDFIVSGMHAMFELIVVVIQRIIDEEEDDGEQSIDLDWVEGEMKELHDTTQSIYKCYKGKPVTITLRLSPKFIDFIEVVNFIGPKFENLQDFARSSTALYVNRKDTTFLQLINQRGLIEEATKKREEMENLKTEKVGTIVEGLIQSEGRTKQDNTNKP